jgi:hypothetical protein
VIVLLALLGAPRAIGHDQDLIKEGTLINTLFVFVPFIIWLAVVLIKKVPRPFLTLFIIGAIYGIFLAVVHQINWNGFWGDNPPVLGGNLEGKLSPDIESLVLRMFSFLSSFVSGLVTGAILGIVATALQKITKSTP